MFSRKMVEDKATIKGQNFEQKKAREGPDILVLNI